ncbi:hypothetical protein GCM10022220_11700 [Actinocatenispora rupis]|uniref:histidine kinase n=1 Tax=Actinocatenispora rupis TaxID=519421 RepID=A0A8J3J0M4_9ACTN|nr:hypothetical protein Aru02nite_07240 [Actinocatenispora rupis]
MAVALLVLAALGSVPLAGGTGSAVVWAVTALQVVTSAAVPALRARPVAVSVLVAAVVVVGLLPSVVAPGALTDRYAAVNLWPPIALFSAVVGLRRYAPRTRAPALWVLIAVATVLAAHPWRPTWSGTPVGILHTAVPALLGLYLAARWQMVQALRDRAEQAERERVLLAEQARAQERSRLASELHDSVAHRVNLMVLQAGALRLTTPDPAVRDAAEALRLTGCQALQELGDLLGMIRRGDTGTGAVTAPPADDLPALVADSRAVGLPVVLAEDGDPGVASPIVRRTAYRIVQEALTNVHRYAPGAAVDVTVRYRTDRVEVVVRNGPAAGPAGLPDTGSGTGLLGLSRRVEALGGTLTAGPAESGGFRVNATMPSHVSSR